MNKLELIVAVAERTGESQAAVERILNATKEISEEQVKKGNRVLFVGWFSMERVIRKPKMGRNPRTGEPCPIPERIGVRIRPSEYFGK